MYPVSVKILPSVSNLELLKQNNHQFVLLLYIKKIYYKMYVSLTFKVTQTKKTNTNFAVSFKCDFFI